MGVSVAAGGSPIMAALLPAIMAKMAAAGGGGGNPSMPGSMPGMPPGGPGTGPAGSPADSSASAMFGKSLSDARQADPAALGQRIGSVKQEILDMINQTGMSNPGVARALSKCLQGLDSAVKEAAQAAATLQVATPIQASAAAGAPGAAGPSPVGIPGMGSF